MLSQSINNGDEFFFLRESGFFFVLYFLYKYFRGRERERNPTKLKTQRLFKNLIKYHRKIPFMSLLTRKELRSWLSYFKYFSNIFLYLNLLYNKISCKNIRFVSFSIKLIQKYRLSEMKLYRCTAISNKISLS